MLLYSTFSWYIQMLWRNFILYFSGPGKTLEACNAVWVGVLAASRDIAISGLTAIALLLTYFFHHAILDRQYYFIRPHSVDAMGLIHACEEPFDAYKCQFFASLGPGNALTNCSGDRLQSTFRSSRRLHLHKCFERFDSHFVWKHRILRDIRACQIDVQLHLGRILHLFQLRLDRQQPRLYLCILGDLA